MHVRPLLLTALLIFLGPVHAQTGGWTVDSDFDLYSYGGLGSVWTTAQQHPPDLTRADAALVVGCDPMAPFGVEIAAWVAPLGTTSFGPATDAALDVDVMVRFDQGPILHQTWFVTEGYFQTETVAYYDLNETLLAGMADAATMALRIRADAARGVQERTFVYDVRGFGEALARLACAQDEPPPAMAPATPDPFADATGGDAGEAGLVRIGAWTFDGTAGMSASDTTGAVSLYCVGDGNGIEIEVGDYALTGDAYEVRFRSGSIDFLTATAARNAFDAAQLDDDGVEDRLVRFLRGVVDLTITISPTSGAGRAMSYTVPTAGFNDALARLACYRGGR
jgi:invasion protein IalB